MIQAGELGNNTVRLLTAKQFSKLIKASSCDTVFLATIKEPKEKDQEVAALLKRTEEPELTLLLQGYQDLFR